MIMQHLSLRYSGIEVLGSSLFGLGLIDRSNLLTDPEPADHPNALRAAPLLFSAKGLGYLPLSLKRDEPPNYEAPSYLVDIKLIVYLRSGCHI